MSLTNFAALTDEELTVWSRDFWSNARNASFMTQFTGTSHSSMIHKITDLTKTKKGARAVMTLVKDLEGDGVAGDRTLEGNEEALKSEDLVIRIDQLRHANRHEGKMADQKSVVTFRKESRDKLGYWMGDRIDQMVILALSGVDFSNRNNGTTRTGSDLVNLEFAEDVLAPSANRHFQWDSANGLSAVDHSTLEAADTLSWKALVEAKAFAEESYMKPIRMEGGVALYHVFMSPTAMAKLKQDSDFLANLRSAAPRSTSNPLFKGAESYYVDGLAIHSHRHIYNTRGAASGSKWGGTGTVDGCRVLICGAQALGLADIGGAEWVEKGFDYDNQQGISIGKVFGMLKPQFTSVDTGTTEDFGVLCLDVAQ